MTASAAGPHQTTTGGAFCGVVVRFSRGWGVVFLPDGTRPEGGECFGGGGPERAARARADRELTYFLLYSFHLQYGQARTG